MNFPLDIKGIVIYPASWAKSHKSRWTPTNTLNAREYTAKTAPRIDAMQLALPQELSGTIFSSPHDRPYPLRHKQAASRLFSQRQRDFLLAGDLAARRHLGLSPDDHHNAFTHFHGIGSWENNVEPAMTTVFHKPISALQLQKIGAEVGTWARQHGILVFSPHPQGTEQLLHMRIPTHDHAPYLTPHDVERVSKRITDEFNKHFDKGEHGDINYLMPGRTILPDIHGFSDVLVWVPPWESNKGRVHDAFASIGEHMGMMGKVHYWPGQGMLLGGTSPYSDEEAAHFDDAQKRQIAIENYRRAMEARETSLVNPEPVEPQRLELQTAGVARRKGADTSPTDWEYVPGAAPKTGEMFNTPHSVSAPSEPTPHTSQPQSHTSQPPESSIASSSSSSIGANKFKWLKNQFITPDDLWGGGWGEPEETFVAFDPNNVYRDDGNLTHWQLLEDVDFGQDPEEEPRLAALNAGAVVGRTGQVHGRRVTSFWNSPHHDDAVKAYVLAEIQRGNLHPHDDWISFKGNNGLMRAGKFVNYTAPLEEKIKRQWTPEELAQAHVNPLLKAMILPEEAKSSKSHIQRAFEALGIVHPGHKWWAPMSEQRHGEPVRLDSGPAPAAPATPKKPKKSKRTRSPGKTGVVVRGVYYPPGEFSPGIIQAAAEDGSSSGSSNSSAMSRLMEWARKRRKGKPVGTSVGPDATPNGNTT